MSALPKGHGHGHGHLHRRGARGGCICTKTIQASEATSQAGSGAIVYAADSSSSSSSDSGSWENGSGSESWDDNGSGSSGSGTVQKVVYFNYVPVPVPMVTTCQTSGTIVIENDITINVTVAPTVPLLLTRLMTGNHVYEHIYLDPNGDNNSHQRSILKTFRIRPRLIQRCMVLLLQLPLATILVSESVVYESLQSSHPSPQILLARPQSNRLLRHRRIHLHGTLCRPMGPPHARLFRIRHHQFRLLHQYHHRRKSHVNRLFHSTSQRRETSLECRWMGIRK